MPEGPGWLIARLLCVPAWGSLLVADWLVVHQLTSTVADTRARVAIVGIPVMEVARTAGLVRIHYGWGALLVLVGPLVAGMLVAAGQVAWALRMDGWRGAGLWG